MKVYGKEGRDEEFRPFAVTQYTTVEELIEMVKKSIDSSASIDHQFQFRLQNLMNFSKLVRRARILS